MTKILVNVKDITVDHACQARARMQQSVVREYSAALLGGATFPPLIIFQEPGTLKMWLADGFHRIAAALSLALPQIEVQIFPGGKREAWKYSRSANVLHGLRRSNEDKRSSVTGALQDEECRLWSDRKIAELCGCGHPLVAQIRRELEDLPVVGDVQVTFDAIRKGADGRVRRLPKLDSKPKKAEPSTLGGEKPRFNICVEMGKLEQILKEQFASWPEENRHSFCVELREFAIDNNEEVKAMSTLAFDEVLKRKNEVPQ